MSKKIIVDIEKCVACRGCELACALIHSESQVIEKAINESPLPQSRVKVENGNGAGVPIQCRQCQDAPCLEVCPSNALHREQVDGPVLLEREKCTGCKFCLLACPFGAIKQVVGDKVMVKCDLCYQLIQSDEKPACVNGCPTGALQYGENGEFPKVKGESIAEDVPETAEGQDTGKEVRCKCCDKVFATVKQFEFVQRKVGQEMQLPRVCSSCRSVQRALKLASNI